MINIPLALDSRNEKQTLLGPIEREKKKNKKTDCGGEESDFYKT